MVELSTNRRQLARIGTHRRAGHVACVANGRRSPGNDRAMNIGPDSQTVGQGPEPIGDQPAACVTIE
jgi:hypothetical protein